jgi:hypothetical protein
MHPGVQPETPLEKIACFQFGNEEFFVLARKARGCAESYRWYVAQASPKIDAARAEKDRYRIETP